MSSGNPKKFKDLGKLHTSIKDLEEKKMAKVYKDKNHEVKKALSFKTDDDKPKLT